MEIKTRVIKKETQNLLHTFGSIIICRFKLNTFEKIICNLHQDVMDAENIV